MNSPVKKSIIAILAVIILIAAWYLISPLWRNIYLDEPSPVVGDNLETMDADARAEFNKQLEITKDKVVAMSDKMPDQTKIISQGIFKARAHDVEGKALLIENGGKRILRFENFKTINGPNLHIYLGADLSNEDFIDLGRIKATEGNVNYEVDDSVNITKYNKVMVWCVPFRVLFSYAELNL